MFQCDPLRVWSCTYNNMLTAELFHVGSLGLVVHPATGIWRSIQNKWGKEKVDRQRATRITDGLEAVSKASSKELDAIITKFKGAYDSTAERQERYKKMAEHALQSLKEGDSREQIQDPNPMSEQLEQEEVVDIPLSDEEAEYHQEMQTAMRASLQESGQTTDADANAMEANFERDLAHAMQLSLVEQ
jgi:hypothetical protein